MKRNAIPMKRNAIPMEAERYPDEKGPRLAGLGRNAIPMRATLCHRWEPQGKLRLALGAVLDATLCDDLQPLQLAYSPG